MLTVKMLLFFFWSESNWRIRVFNYCGRGRTLWRLLLEAPLPTSVNRRFQNFCTLFSLSVNTENFIPSTVHISRVTTKN